MREHRAQSTEHKAQTTEHRMLSTNFFPSLVCILCSVLCCLNLSCVTTSHIEDAKQADVHYKIGISYLTEQRLHDASIEFQKALSLNPQDKYSLNALGLISQGFGKYGEAISYFKQALSIDPSYSDAVNNLGVTHMEMGSMDEAIGYFQAAVRNPLYATPEKAFSNMGYALYRKGDYPEAADALKKAVIRNPYSPQALYVLGLVQVKLGEDNQAIESFKRAVTITPEYIDAHWELGNAYIRTGDKEQAMEHFKTVLDRSSDPLKRRDALQLMEELR